MKQRFFTNTIKSNFIKALIYNTPIPLIGSVNDKSYILKDNIYIYKNNIIKCTKSGIIKMPEIEPNYNAYYKNGSIEVISSEVDDKSDKYENIIANSVKLEKGSFKIIDTYDFGKYYPKFTELYYSKYGYYDSQTHEYLGKLLRLYRDILEINLMPYYNCVSGNYISGIVIYPDKIKEEPSDNYKTFKIPIKFNTNYTLAIDSNSNVKTATVLLSGNHIIEDIQYYKSGSLLTFNPNDVVMKNINIFSSMSFKQPKLVGINILKDENASIIEKYERYLYLLIQIPRTNNSSVVLLEGDYTNVKAENVYSIEGIQELNDLELSDIMTSDLSLLQMNDNITYPFADRLIEYLLLNVINPRDEVTKNIGRVQDLFINYDSIHEVWNNTLRSNIYIGYQKNDMIRRLDLNGFVDIDTERLMKKLN